MKIQGLKVYTGNRRKFPVVESLRLVDDKGVEGDRAFGTGGIVRLLTVHTIGWMKEAEPRGLCFSRFNEHIIIDTKDEDNYTPTVGDILTAGEAAIEITKVGKGCFSECEREQGKMGCLLKESCLYGKIVSGGKINVGMEICIKTPDLGKN